MAKVEFDYKQNITAILCNEDERMEEICLRFKSKSLIDIKNVYFLYGGNSINQERTFNEIINDLDRQRKTMRILVIKLEIKDYKINLSECKNNHSINLLINEYEVNQSIDLRKIECNNCKKNKYETFDNLMYICNGCNIILCPLCKNIHDKKHNIINYDLRNTICNIHNEIYISYCKTCKINICLKCIKEHKKHDILPYSDILPDKDELLNKLKELEKEKDKLINDINDMINKLNNIKDNITIIYNIYNNMINKYEDKYRNYEILESINNMNIINDIKNIKFENIMNIYEKMNNLEITMIYNVDNKDTIKILGKTFINNNKDKCKLIYNNKEYDLMEEFEVKDLKKLEIKLIGINNVTTMECMFYECKLLESLPDISLWNTNKVTDMSYLFYGCISLKSLPNISIWNISNLKDKTDMFTNCSKKLNIPQKFK